jgi:hypothetical protein
MQSRRDGLLVQLARHAVSIRAFIVTVLWSSGAAFAAYCAYSAKLRSTEMADWIGRPYYPGDVLGEDMNLYVNSYNQVASADRLHVVLLLLTFGLLLGVYRACRASCKPLLTVTTYPRSSE